MPAAESMPPMPFTSESACAELKKVHEEELLERQSHASSHRIRDGRRAMHRPQCVTEGRRAHARENWRRQIFRHQRQERIEVLVD